MRATIQVMLTTEDGRVGILLLCDSFEDQEALKLLLPKLRSVVEEGLAKIKERELVACEVT